MKDKWRVQVGKGKGAYKDRYVTTSETQAEALYNGLNTHSGHKKRLVAPDGKVVDRIIT
jgi:hypothetical protein